MSTVVKLRPKQALRLHCSQCGAEAEATCDCGVGYMSAGEYAAKAVAEHPEMSNRAIAEQFGLGLGTVNRARQSSEPNGSPETRTGLDGKQHPTERKPPRPEPSEESESSYSDDEQDQILQVMLRLLCSVDHKHRKKFQNHLDESSFGGVYVPSCGYRGWKAGGYAVDSWLIQRLAKAVTRDFDE